VTVYSNPCVVCGVRPFQRCVVPRTGRKTDTHMRRVRGEWPAPPVRPPAPPTAPAEGDDTRESG
jgi:hypothetical protein